MYSITVNFRFGTDVKEEEGKMMPLKELVCDFYKFLYHKPDLKEKIGSSQICHFHSLDLAFFH